MIDNIFLDPNWKIDGKTDDEIIAEWEREECELELEDAEEQRGRVEAHTLEALTVVDSIKSMENLYRSDGLVARSVDKDGSEKGSDVSSDLNALWGLLLHATGRTAEADKVVESLKSLKNLYRPDGLIGFNVNKDRSEKISSVNSYRNALWGLLLHATGRTVEADKVVESITSLKNLYRSDGLVARSVDKDGSERNSAVWSDLNALWGLLLHATGRVAEADKVVESIKSLNNLYRTDGLVAGSVHKDGGERTSVVSLYHNALWGLLLHATGRAAEADKVVESIKSLKVLYRPDGLVGRYVDKDGSEGHSAVYSDLNALWGLLLHATGRAAEADKVVESIKSLNDLYRTDGLVAGFVDKDGSEGDSDVYSYCNALWGLLLQPDGYKVFTGGTL